MFGQVFLGTFKKRRIPTTIPDGWTGKDKSGCYSFPTHHGHTINWASLAEIKIRLQYVYGHSENGSDNCRSRLELNP